MSQKEILSTTSGADSEKWSDIYLEISNTKKSARALRRLETEKKNQALLHLADQVSQRTQELVQANHEDLKNLAPDTPSAFRDRLTLTHDRIQGMVESLRQVALLPDPVGELVENRKLANGLLLKRVRAPLGVILMIFESRPNVILEAFSLAFKTGNAIVLRGGSESKNSAACLYQIMRDSLSALGLERDFFYGLNVYDRGLVEGLLKRKDLIDIVVPRGGEKLIEFVQRNALMPIIKNDRGLCHAYVDNEADLRMATRIVSNAKTQRPGVCNSLETLLVHQDVAQQFLPMLFEATQSVPLRWKCDAKSLQILNGRMNVEAATDQDWDSEHLDQILNCRVIADLDEALEHIEKYGSKHSEVIITQNESKARLFQSEVDAAAVYWNASTRFTDGFQFGLGGELGISTQKLHVRGPVGLRELTTPRWVIDGSGQIREA